jgi:hypothetical protein
MGGQPDAAPSRRGCGATLLVGRSYEISVRYGKNEGRGRHTSSRGTFTMRILPGRLGCRIFVNREGMEWHPAASCQQ